MNDLLAAVGIKGIPFGSLTLYDSETAWTALCEAGGVLKKKPKQE